VTLEALIDLGVMPLLGAAVLLVVWRVLRGPTAADRIVALDALAATGAGLACALAVRSGQAAVGDVVLVLSLVVFLATLAYARFLERPR
jgi:multicomponent Na+:H+ antiporter subunit F